MKLISPKFLQICEGKKAKILKVLFEDEDIFKVVMSIRGLNFVDACEWIADEIFDMEIPEATEAEKKLMKLAAKEMMDND